VRHSVRTKGTTIYLLVDPRESDAIKRVRYVGKTSQRPMARYWKHLKAARMPDEISRESRTHCARWIRCLLGDGVEPSMIQVARVEPSEAPDTETRLIARMRELGAPLTNLTTGGEGTPGIKRTPEQIERIRVLHRGRKRSLETCARISAAARQSFATDPTRREKIATAAKFRATTIEGQAHYARLAAMKKATPMSEGQRRKLSLAQKGKKITADHRLKLLSGLRRSLARPEKRTAMLEQIERLAALKRGKPGTMLGRKWSAESRRKLSVATTGRVHPPVSDETKKKMSEARKTYWVNHKAVNAIYLPSEFHPGLDVGSCI